MYKMIIEVDNEKVESRYKLSEIYSVCSTITFLAKFSLDWLDSDWHSASRMMHDFPTLQLQC